MTFLLARLAERSTWTGIGILLPLVGIHFAPETWQAVISAGMALAGLAAVLLRTTPKAPAPAADPHATVAPAAPAAPFVTSPTSANSGGGAG